jgi:hypothetical protein
MATLNRRGPNLIMAGGAAVIIGAFLPWFTGSGPFIGTISKSGISGGDGSTDGWLVVAVGALLLLLGYGRHVGGQVRALGLTVALGGGLWLVEYNEVGGRVLAVRGALVGNPFVGAVSVDLGIGLWLVAAGLAAATVGTFTLRRDLAMAHFVAAVTQAGDSGWATEPADPASTDPAPRP